MSVRPHECVDRNDNVRGGTTAIHIARLRTCMNRNITKTKKEIENMETLRFNISGQEVLTFEINHKNQTARLLASPDELASHVILTPDERNTKGSRNV